MMYANQKGRALIKHFEGKPGSGDPVLEAYLCPAGKWTIGWGHTGDVKKGDRITYHQAEAIFDLDVDSKECGVFDLLARTTCNENQFSALVSFAFNFGVTKLARSTLMEKLHAGDAVGAAAQFPLWKWAFDDKKKTMVVMNGLVLRRAAERELFESLVCT